MAEGQTTNSITLQRIEQRKRGLDGLAPSRINFHSIQNILQSQINDQDHSTVTTITSSRSRVSAQDPSTPLALKEVDCLKTMLRILSVEDSCSLLSREIDLRTLASINDDNAQMEEEEEDARRRSSAICRKTTTAWGASRTRDNDDNIPGFISPSSQICINSIRNSWKWIATLSKCLSIHLENSANYHQFFAEFSEDERWMREDLNQIHRIYEEHESREDFSDAARLIEELQRVGVALSQWRSKVDRMWTNAQTLFPVDLRTRDVHEEEATPAKALCHFATNEIDFAEGEDLLLLETTPGHRRSDPPVAGGVARWRMRNGRGQTGEVPSVIILIPGIDPNAIHAAVQLRLTLLAEWTDILKTSGRHLMAFLLNVFKAEYTDYEMQTLNTMPEDGKHQLLRMLSCIEDVLKCIWPEHADFISLQQRITLLRGMLLDQQQPVMMVRQLVPTRKATSAAGTSVMPTLVVQINSLQRLLEVFQASIVLPLRELHFKTEALRVYRLQTACTDIRPIEAMWDLWESWNVIRISPQLNGHPKIQELIEKWERQQTANRVFFASFWRSETPIYEMERTLADLYRFQIAGIILQSPADANVLTTTCAPTHSTTDTSSESTGGGLLHALPSPDSACPMDHDDLDYEDEEDGSDLGIGTETRTAHTEQYSSTESEESRRFVIRSIIHPENGQEISLQEAVEVGVICHSDGTYRNTSTGEAKPIPLAMNEGFINVMFTTTKRSKEKKSSIGVITVKTIREQTRPYHIHFVLDTRTGQEMTREEAVERNIIDEGHGTYLNRQTGRKMLIVEAIELGLISVEYSGDVLSPPDIISNTYAVHGVVDRARQKVVTFLDAMQRGIVDREAGTYQDTLTGQRMYVGDAILQGYMKGRIVEDVTKLNVDDENVFTINNTEGFVIIKPTTEDQ